MLTYEDVATYLTGYLTGLGTYDPLPFFFYGFDPDALNMSPDRQVLLTVGGGSGLASEGVFDRPTVQVRTIGFQTDYSSTEQLAHDCDRAMFELGPSSTLPSGKRVLTVYRIGGSPQYLLKDAGDRYHFTCNYIWEVAYV